MSAELIAGGASASGSAVRNARRPARSRSAIEVVAMCLDSESLLRPAAARRVPSPRSWWPWIVSIAPADAAEVRLARAP